MFRVRDLKNDTIVVDNLSKRQDALSWVSANVAPPTNDDDGNLEIANASIEEY